MQSVTWWPIFLYLITYGIRAAPILYSGFKKKDLVFGLIFICLFIGYIYLITSVGYYALYLIFNNSVSAYAMNIITTFTVPLGIFLGRALIKRELKGEKKRFNEKMDLFNLFTDFFFFPLVSFLLTFLAIFIYFIINF